MGSSFQVCFGNMADNSSGHTPVGIDAPDGEVFSDPLV